MTILRAADIPRDELHLVPIANLRQQIINDHDVDQAERAKSARLAALIEGAVLRRLGGRLRNFTVLVRRGGVILRGLAPTYHVRQLAQHAAAKVTRLRVQANDIQVLAP